MRVKQTAEILTDSNFQECLIERSETGGLNTTMTFIQYIHYILITVTFTKNCVFRNLESLVNKFHLSSLCNDYLALAAIYAHIED